MRALDTRVCPCDRRALTGACARRGTFAFGYGGQFGVHQQTDKAAHDFDSKPANTETHTSVPKYEKPAIQGQNSSIRGKFESLSKSGDSEREQQDRIAAERAARAEKERAEVRLCACCPVRRS